MLAACFLAGLAEANVAVAQSAVAEIAPVAQRSRLFGYVYLSASLAYVVGPLAGGKLADPGLISWFDYATPFWAVAIGLGGILALTALHFRETSTAAAPGQLRLTQALPNLTRVFAPGAVRQLYLANFVRRRIAAGRHPGSSPTAPRSSPTVGTEAGSPGLRRSLPGERRRSPRLQAG